MKTLFHMRLVSQRGSTLVIVLWIALGLVSLTLYFAQSMLGATRASSHRVEGIAAEQAIEGGMRYVLAVLNSQLTNGYLPSPNDYLCNAVTIRNTTGAQDDSYARFWLIGRTINDTVTSREPFFGLVDEASKININTVRSNVLLYLTDWNAELTEAILDWRSTNGPGTTLSWYGMQSPSYECKQAPFETVDEMRMLFGVSEEFLEGEDANRNGVLDFDEVDENRDGIADGGLLDLVTVYSREPNTYSNETTRVNISMLTSANQDFANLLRDNLSADRANAILQRLGLQGGGQGQNSPPVRFTSPLQLFRAAQMTVEECAAIEDKITTVESEFIEGRVNLNTAPSRVLACLPGLTDSPDLVDLLVNYRVTNPDRLISISWIVEALGENNQEALNELERRDILTTRSYQFTADIAATGAFGRGYRRAKFVIDTAAGYARAIYRQDLTYLGWALGEDVRQNFKQGQRDGRLARSTHTFSANPINGTITHN